ncbi:MAG: hypothetical protein GXX79_08120 [Actinomycetales bacterium]|nr:hypothetical protein [Actinomycetales bacterium]
MDLLLGIVVVLHLLGMAAIVGSWSSTLRTPRVLPGMVHGALLQLVTGVVLVGLHEAGAGDDDVNNAKIGVKLLVTLVVVGLAWVNRRRAGSGPDGGVAPGIFHAIGGLTILNVVIAVLW